LSSRNVSNRGKNDKRKGHRNNATQPAEGIHPAPCINELLSLYRQLTTTQDVQGRYIGLCALRVGHSALLHFHPPTDTVD
jgi:hypothetical protein